MADDHDERLEPPARSSIDDPGAHDLESSDSEDHFSDAQSGLEPTSTDDTPVPAVKVPHTRVEKVDDEASYGEEPGTEAYRLREQDAAPDEIAIVPEHTTPRISTPISKPSTPPGGQPIPLMIVEKVDPSSPSHGEVPGTLAHDMRAADAVPDLVVRSGERSRSSSTRSRAGSTPGDLPIPITKVEKIDSSPRHGEVPGTKAYELRRGDAEPDIVEEVGETPGSPTSPGARSPIINHARRKSSAAGRKGPTPVTTDEYNEDEDGSDGGFGDDFDDFEEGEDAEFGDFDDGFQEAAPAPPPPQSIPITPSFPVLDFAELDSPEDIQAATEKYMNALFPSDSIHTSVLPPLSAENSIFLTPRSASLWSQLVAPPPLQPPNWIRSRIRRLFLVSLGVPVDLDEILPASKQKKLILPSMNLNPASGSPRNSTESRPISRLKQGEGNASSTSVDSQGKPSRSDSRRRKGPPPAPQLDLISARQLCSFTDEALEGLTLEELKAHVKKLEDMQGTAKEVLEYWTKRTDEKLGDREAFEGVIENLVKHARKVRK
ncbi:hypothetical protein ONS95_007793 [Cadophora gregata]|uniref:uncharacterized protein n=1 Tax=Cadophora gregata TaxID=51156 RepID=UPI0026DA8C8D|nr:uncharacterized protein ONS95_007793 [Cadophora gregata]KAK0118922.1 hypothetical protein ONS96_011998 [Cadophora gregata f. sp. sojae]KAK0126176.1 hypothetical protein ONS95_007793 [Cadophora gregata]